MPHSRHTLSSTLGVGNLRCYLLGGGLLSCGFLLRRESFCFRLLRGAAGSLEPIRRDAVFADAIPL